MFFGSRKKKKLAEEARQKEQQRIQEEAFKKACAECSAYAENAETFYRICDMVRSLPKKRHIVVVQRENVFRSNSDRNYAYLKLARKLHYQHQSTGQRWMSAFGENDDALYAFYEPTKMTYHFRNALDKFSEDGYRIQHIRYYSQNLWITVNTKTATRLE